MLLYGGVSGDEERFVSVCFRVEDRGCSSDFVSFAMSNI